MAKACATPIENVCIDIALPLDSFLMLSVMSGHPITKLLFKPMRALKITSKVKFGDTFGKRNRAKHVVIRAKAIGTLLPRISYIKAYAGNKTSGKT